MSAQEIRFTEGSLAAIMSIAQERNKNVFIDTYADWCVPCKRMEEKFKNKDVAAFYNEHFINYRVNMQNPTRAAELRQKYDVVFLPTMFILDPNGIIKYQVDKELSVSELLNAGQAALDPNSYFVSEATAVRRKDGTITGGISNTENTAKNKAIVTSAPQVNQTNNTSTNSTLANKTSTKRKIPIDPTEGNISISEATRRAKILDSYETVEESSEKVLAVLGEDELPPEILREEAYLRLEFMDGSSKSAAAKYLATQTDWSTDANRKFIMDFVTSTFSEEYRYLCSHKEDFIAQFGASNVRRTLEVLTYRTLHNAVPRPTLAEAVVLYHNLDAENSKTKATHYFVNRLIADENTEEVLDVSSQYLQDHGKDHQMMYMVARYISNTIEPDKDELKKAISLSKKASKLNPDSLIYLELLAALYNDKGDAKEARKTLEKAMQVAKEKGGDYKKYEAKITAAEGLR